MVVLVDLRWQSGSTLPFAGVEAFENPLVGQRALEAFNLAVGLWPVQPMCLGVTPSSAQIKSRDVV